MINGKRTAEIISVLLSNLTADGYNMSKKYYIMNHWFNCLYHYYIDNSSGLPWFTVVLKMTKFSPKRWTALRINRCI